MSGDVSTALHNSEQTYDANRRWKLQKQINSKEEASFVCLGGLKFKMD